MFQDGKFGPYAWHQNEFFLALSSTQLEEQRAVSSAIEHRRTSIEMFCCYGKFSC